MREKIEAAFEDRALLEDDEYRQAAFDAVTAPDSGGLRVAEPGAVEYTDGLARNTE